MKTQIYSIDEMTQAQLAEVAHAVQGGALVALATDTVYGLAANAFEEDAIERIYNIKKRPADMPLQILIDSTKLARSLVRWNEKAAQLARAYWPGPLTLILPPNATGQPLARGFAGLGLRVPNHPGLLRFLSVFRRPLACTSANEHGRPVITTEAELCDFCQHRVEFILLSGALSPVASSVVDLTTNAVLLREGALSRQELEKTLNGHLK